MTLPLTMGWIGGGQMATALAKGWLAAGLINAKKSLASDPSGPARLAFTTVTGLKVVETNAEVMDKADAIVLAVKPQHMPGVLSEIRPLLKKNILVISIAGGITLRTLDAGLGEAAIVRVMPNQACLVGASASAYTANEHVTKEQLSTVNELLEAVGIALPLPEKLLDAVTGLSGSGPAYFYLVIEAMADGGVKAGLPRDVALKLAARTCLGAAKMVIDTHHHPAVLKDSVTSPGGTTIAGLFELESAGVRAAFISAVEAATIRAYELGQMN